jgi:hypothetical protein
VVQHIKQFEMYCGLLCLRAADDGAARAAHLYSKLPTPASS